MSGIYIKGMEMPKKCWDCQLKSSCDVRVFWIERPSGCPLVAVPDHGRLIIEDGEVVE